MIKLEMNLGGAAIYRNTCCMCCGIPQVSPQYFKNPEGKAVRATVDHVLLRSLGGSSSELNLVTMCYDCNQLRGNLFAELPEFIDWYWSSEDLPVLKNFSYLSEQPRNKRVKYIPSGGKALPSKNNSVPIKIVEMNGIKYQEYKHPLFGTSMVRLENTK